MYVLGINAYHEDSSACLVKDGQLLTAVEEERFRRIKHYGGFPSESIRFCLEDAGIGIEDVEHIAINSDPKSNIWKKVRYTLSRHPELRWIMDRFRKSEERKGVRDEIEEVFSGSKVGGRCIM